MYRILVSPTAAEIDAAIRDLLDEANRDCRSRTLYPEDVIRGDEILSEPSGKSDYDAGSVSSRYRQRWQAHTTRFGAAWATTGKRKVVVLVADRHTISGRTVPSIFGYWGRSSPGKVIAEYQAQERKERERRKKSEEEQKVWRAVERFQPDPAWLVWNDGVVRKLAERIHREKEATLLPILADAMEEAGCTNEKVLRHLRNCDCFSRRRYWQDRCVVVECLVERAKGMELRRAGSRPCAPRRRGRSGRGRRG